MSHIRLLAGVFRIPVEYTGRPETMGHTDAGK